MPEKTKLKDIEIKLSHVLSVMMILGMAFTCLLFVGNLLWANKTEFTELKSDVKHNKSQLDYIAGIFKDYERMSLERKFARRGKD